jgi:hypothetical protein
MELVDCERLLKCTADADYEWHYLVKMPMNRTASIWKNLYEQLDQSAAFCNGVVIDVKWDCFCCVGTRLL